MASDSVSDPGYRFPAEVIHHATWLYHLFALSLRDIERILAERGVVVSPDECHNYLTNSGYEFE